MSYYDPAQGYYDVNQGYYDPNQGYYDTNQGYYDPSQGYYDPNSGQSYVNEEFHEDTESTNLKKEQADKERLEALESNRLYLRKVRKQCVKEDFAELDRKQLFLFEILIESLEVNSVSDLGVTPSVGYSDAYVTVWAQFLNSPYFEINEKNKEHPSSSNPSSSDPSSYAELNNYLQTVGDSWQSTNQQTFSHSASNPSNSPDSTAVEHPSSGEVIEDEMSTELEYDVKWENATGKSCLFSMSVLEMIHNLDMYPVNIQVDRCVSQMEEGGLEEQEPLGYASIRLPDEFNMAILESLRSGAILPISSLHRQTCDLRNVFGVKKGKAEVLVRLLVFGPVIVTSFHSVGDDRHYVFQPGPVTSKGDKREHQTPRSEILKPIISEEENSVGITIQKDADIFQKPVLWKVGVQHCACEDSLYARSSNMQGSDFDKLSVTKIPFSNKTNLCRNMKPPTDSTITQKFGNHLCNWHNLVSLEIKNSPIGNCGCLAEGDYTDRSKENHTDRTRENHTDRTKAKNKEPKGRGQLQHLPPITGMGVQQELVGCKCDCPFIKAALMHAPFQE